MAQIRSYLESHHHVADGIGANLVNGTGPAQMSAGVECSERHRIVIEAVTLAHSLGFEHGRETTIGVQAKTFEFDQRSQVTRHDRPPREFRHVPSL